MLISTKLRAILLCIAIAPPAFAADLLRVGQFHGEEVKHQSGLTWIGLFPTSEAHQYDLKETKVTISTVNDPIVDDPKQKTGKKVAVTSKEEPIVLLRGVPGLKVGKRVTCTVRMDQLPVGTKMKLNTGKDVTSLIVSGKKGKESVANYSIVVERAGIKQELFKEKEITPDGTPKLLWSGDLDGDGHADFLIDLTSNYNMTQPTLFLSSKAKPGKLVEKVASHTATGC